MNGTVVDAVDHPPTLFILVAAIALNRVLDFLTIKQKLEQLASRVTGCDDFHFSYSTLKRTAESTKEVRAVLRNFHILMHVRREYYFLLGGLCLLLFLILGCSTSVFPEVEKGYGTAATFVLALVTALMSVCTSLLNFAIEKVRLHM